MLLDTLTHLEFHPLPSHFTLPPPFVQDHNYCRNPDQDERPWCFVSARDYDYCDIPRCQAADTAADIGQFAHAVDMEPLAAIYLG